MMPFVLHERVAPRVSEIEKAGGHCSDFDWILQRLRFGRDIPERFNDHVLAGKLHGLRSVIVGHDDRGRTVVMVYQVINRRVTVIIVDEHDQAYQALTIERTRR